MINWSSPDARIGATRFTVHNVLWMPRWSRMAREDEICERFRRNAIGLCYTLEAICQEFGWIIEITSFYRTPEYNRLREVGGSPSSRHMRGMAVDFKVEGVSADEVRDVLRLNLSRYCLRLEDEAGLSWVHIDTDGIGPFKIK